MRFITVSAKSLGKVIKMYLESFGTWWLSDAVCGAGGLIPQGKSPWCSCCAGTKEHLQPQRLQRGEGHTKTLVGESREEKGRSRSAEAVVEP